MKLFGPARVALAVFFVFALSAGCNGPPAAPPSGVGLPAATQPSQAVQTYRRWVAELTDESMEGRGPGTAGLVKAREYLVQQFQAMGLRPAFGGSFCQPFEMPLGVRATRQELAILDGSGKVLARPQPGSDFNALGFSGVGSFRGPAMFVGYGIFSPKRNYDSYAGAGQNSLRGKVAVAFRYEPQDERGRSRWAESGSSSLWTRAASVARKAQRAAGRGAVALLVVNPPSQDADKTLLKTQGTSLGLKADIPVMHIRPEVFERMLRSADREGHVTVKELQALADTGGGKVESLPGVSLKGLVQLKSVRGLVHNVAAVLSGAGELADEGVVVGAHYDHLGCGGFGSRSGAREIHPGADDNASGVAGVLMLAKWYSDRVAGLGGKAAPGCRRTLVFAGFTAEERGLLGSRHMAEHLDDLGIKPAQLVAMISMDMIGRLRQDTLRVGGVDSGDGWARIVHEAGEKAGLKVWMIGPVLWMSDHASFYRKNVPVLHVYTGMNPDCHTSQDTPDKINAAGAIRALGFVDAVVRQLWADPKPPAYVPPERIRGADTAYLGIRPNPGSAFGTDGCELMDVLSNTPVAKAGLKAGDVIVKWNDRRISNSEALLLAVRAGKPGERVELEVRRDDELIKVVVELGRR